MASSADKNLWAMTDTPESIGFCAAESLCKCCLRQVWGAVAQSVEYVAPWL